MSDGEQRVLPVFPLPGVVFLPHCILPLHIFEPRYRALVRHCLEEGSPFVLGAIAPGHEHDQLGNPPLAGVMVSSRLIEHEALDDGRYHVLVSGEQRVSLDAEVELTDGYRCFETTTLDEVGGDGLAARQTISACVAALSTRWPSGAEALSRVLRDTPEASVLADRMGSMLISDPVERQNHLECVVVEQRLEGVVSCLVDLVGRLAEPSQG